MNIKNCFSLALLALGASVVMSSCSGDKSTSGQVRPMSEFKNMSAGDSVAYYVGEMSALEYWQNARRDTVMMSQEARDNYLKGLRAGYDAVRDNDAYNLGYYAGVQLARQMKEFTEDYSTTVNKSVLIGALEDGLQNDSILNPGDVQQGFNEVTRVLQERKEAKDRQTAQEELKKIGETKKLQMITPSLYGGESSGGAGENVKEGQQVGFLMKIANLEGKSIDRRENPDMVVGKMYPGPATLGMLTMKIGETRTFYTFAQALLGRFAQRYGLKQGEIITFTITLSAPQTQSTVSDDSAD